MIRVSEVVKTYQNGAEKLFALNRVTFEIDDKDFVVVLGASGSGKSTLLNTISGMEIPDSGSIMYDGEEICGMNQKQLTAFRRRKIAFVFQAYYLLAALNVESNIRMGANLGGVTDVSDIIKSLGLSGKEKKLPGELSGGEQQRVSIARAIAKRPEVLFCDEPTGALDEETGRQILKYLIKVQKELGLTIVMVTHNSNIASLATKVIRMNSGRIVEILKNSSPLTADEIGW